MTSVCMPASPSLFFDLSPTPGRHELRPAPIELPMVALAEAVVTGPGLESRVEALMPQTHFVIQESPAGHHASPGLGALLPVVHVILLESARGTEATHPSQPNGLLDLGRGRLVHIAP